MDHPILLWLDGTHVRWFMCTRLFKSYKIGKSALSTPGIVELCWRGTMG